MPSLADIAQKHYQSVSPRAAHKQTPQPPGQGFWSELANTGQEMNYKNLGTTLGSRVRKMMVDPVVQGLESFGKGIRGEEITLKDLQAIQELLGEVAGLGVTSTLAKAGGKVPDDVLASFAAWHGSGAKFPEFKDRFLSSGVGDQVYGKGHYVATDKDIAEGYARLLGTQGVEFRGRNYTDVPSEFIQTIGDYIHEGAEPQWAIDYVRGELKDKFMQALKAGRDDQVDFYREKLLLLDDVQPDDFKRARDEYLYKTTIMPGQSPEDYKFLDWETRVSDDPKTDELLYFSGLMDEIAGDRTMAGLTSHFYKGKDIVESLEEAFDPDTARDMLWDAGFSGVKYPSRQIFKGSTAPGPQDAAPNYVVFDPKDIRIDERFHNDELEWYRGQHGR